MGSALTANLEPSRSVHDISRTKVSKSGDPRVLGDAAFPKLLVRDETTKLSIALMVGDLLSNQCVFFAIYTRWETECIWDKFVITKPNNEPSKFVSFEGRYELLFVTPKRNRFRFECYSFRSGNDQNDLRAHIYLGSVEVSMMDLIRGRSSQTGWWIGSLDPSEVGAACPGRVAVLVDEDYDSKFNISFGLAAFGLRAAMFDGRANSFVIVSRKHNHRWEEVYKGEVAKSTANPVWQPIRGSFNLLWQMDRRGEIVIEVRHWMSGDRGGRLLGKCKANCEVIKESIASKTLPVFILERPTQKTPARRLKSSASGIDPQAQDWYSTLYEARKASWRKGDIGASYVQIVPYEISRRYTFFDYLRGGLQVRMSLCIDMSLSCRVGSVGGTSKETAYMNILRELGKAMGDFDTDQRYPLYGFAAQLPPTYSFTCDLFALNGNYFKPHVEGVEELCRTYRNALDYARMSGPTMLAPLIKVAIMCAKCNQSDTKTGAMSYLVTLIMTDGDIDRADGESIVGLLEIASTLSLCFLALIVGDAEVRILDEVVSTVRERTRTHHTDGAAHQPDRDVLSVFRIHNCEDEDTIREFVSAALGTIPSDVVSFFNTQKIQPGNFKTFEESYGSDIPKEESVTDARSVFYFDSNAKRKKQPRPNPRDKVPVRSGVDLSYLAERERILTDNVIDLGYNQILVQHVMMNGCPCDSIEMVVDMITATEPGITELCARQKYERERPLELVARVILQGVIQKMVCDRGVLHLMTNDMVRASFSSVVGEQVSKREMIFADRVAASREILNIQDCFGDHRMQRQFDKAYHAEDDSTYQWKSVLFKPIITQTDEGVDDVIAVIQLFNKLLDSSPSLKPAYERAISFSKGDLSLLEEITNDLSCCFMGGSIERRHSVFLEQFRQAHYTSKLKSLLQELHEQLNCERVSLFLYEARAATYFEYRTDLVRSGAQLKGAVHHVFNTGQRLNLLSRVLVRQSFPTECSTTKTLVVVPIFAEGSHLIGVIKAVNKVGVGCTFTSMDVDILEAVGKQCFIGTPGSLMPDVRDDIHHIVRQFNVAYAELEANVVEETIVAPACAPASASLTLARRFRAPIKIEFTATGKVTLGEIPDVHFRQSDLNDIHPPSKRQEAWT